MKSKDCIGCAILCLMYQVSLNKASTGNDFSLEYRLMKLEYTVGQLKESENKLKGKVAALEERDAQQTNKLRRLKEQDIQQINKTKRLEEQIKTLRDAKKFNPSHDVPRTCNELWRMGQTMDGEYKVDPDGSNRGYPPIKVWCSFHENGASTTIPFDGVDLNLTVDVNATSCHGAGCYNVKINYTSPIPQIVALIDLSRECQQPIEYGCENAPLEVNGLPMGWWTDRHSLPQYYWTNTTENKHICSCGLNNSCVEHETFENVCNCDANLPIKERDLGYIRNGSALPITQLYAGTFYGKASFSLGHIECFGEAPYNNGESCDAYRKAGATLSGYYLTMTTGNTTNTTNVPEVSLCDMSKASKDPEFQTDIGALGKFGQGSAVTFNAIRSSEFSQARTILPFDKATVNIGNAFNPNTGTFIAPVDGLYHFAFHGFSTYASNSYCDYEDLSKYYIYKNDLILATTIASPCYYNYQSSAYASFSTSFYELLNSGDSIFIKTGDYVKLYDVSSEHVTQFSGSVMQ